jgi:methyl-accepting chemotaxis protein
LEPIDISMHYGSLAIMDTDRKLGEVAANLDDMSDSIEELKDAAHEGDSPSEGALDDLQQDVEDASAAIDEVVDPERARKP